MKRAWGKGAAILAIAAVTVLLLRWLGGGFEPKIEDRPAPPVRPASTPRPPPRAAATTEVRRIAVPIEESATGTVEAVHPISVASRILSTVVELDVGAGRRVKKDEVLARLDDRDLRARVQQAEAALDAAESRLEKARLDFERARKLREDDVISVEELDRARTRFETAQADRLRARRALEEARTVLGWATIRSPVDGIVVDKRVEVGDTVRPGQTIVDLYDPSRMQLVADVRESLAQRLSPGQEVEVELAALEKRCRATIREIVPSADPRSRTFRVKVTGPCPPGVLSGMFGRLVVPLGQKRVLVVPSEAVRRVGQLDLVDVVEDGGVRRRAVRLGRRFGDDVEVLSGLTEGERVVVRHAG